MEYAYLHICVYILIVHELKSETQVNSAKNNGLVLDINF